MSKYEELQAVSKKALDDWRFTRDRCWNDLSILINGFKAYCEVPSDCFTYLKWNCASREEPVYSPPKEGMQYSIPGAAVFDEEDEFWHVGVQVRLTSKGTIPLRTFSFIICIAEKEGKPVFKLGRTGKRTHIDLTDAMQCTRFYQSIVDIAIQLLQKPSGSTAKTIGFAHSSTLAAAELAEQLGGGEDEG